MLHNIESQFIDEEHLIIKVIFNPGNTPRRITERFITSTVASLKESDIIKSLKQTYKLSIITCFRNSTTNSIKITSNGDIEITGDINIEIDDEKEVLCKSEPSVKKDVKEDVKEDVKKDVDTGEMPLEDITLDEFKKTMNIDKFKKAMKMVE